MLIADHEALLELLALASAGALEHISDEEDEVVTLFVRHPVDLAAIDSILKFSPYLIPVRRHESPDGWVLLLRPAFERRKVFEPFRVQRVGMEWYYDTPENA